MGKTTKIALAGEGGQGVQAIAEIITEAAYEEGKQALYIPNFGVEQRGGVSVAYVQVSDQKVSSPKFKTADVIIALSDRAVSRTRKYCAAHTLFVYDMHIESDDIPSDACRILAIPAIEVAKKELHPRVFNVIIMGAVIGATGVVSVDKIKAAVEKRFGYKFQKNPELRELNYKALQRGIELVEERMGGKAVDHGV